MAVQLNLRVVLFAANGTISKLTVQTLIDHETSLALPLIYEHMVSSFLVKIIIVDKTGPLVSITDAPHVAKTVCNQPQYGTHTASLRIGHVINRSLVELYETGTMGLV